jgi:hypothetical protein
MKQNRLDGRVVPYKGRARPNRIAAILAIIFVLAHFSAPGLLARGAVPKETKEDTKDVQVGPQTAIVEPEDNQQRAEIDPVESRQSQGFPASAATDKGKQIKWQTVSGGAAIGGTSVTFELSRSPDYVLGGTAVQLAVGSGRSDSYILNSGYWQEFGGCPGRGDANGDGVIDIADVMYLINYRFLGASPPNPLCLGDPNCDGVIDAGDVLFLINYLFLNTSPPAC